MKKCFKCGEEKELSEFYKHPQMGDGHVGKCKDCNKVDVQKNYRENIVHFKQYDRGRAMLPHRVKSREEYQATPAGKASIRKTRIKWKKNHPRQRSATDAYYNAMKRGDITRPSSCSICSKLCTPQAHHCDYNKPLEVIFMCTTCHAKWHKENAPLNKG